MTYLLRSRNFHNKNVSSMMHNFKSLKQLLVFFCIYKSVPKNTMCHLFKPSQTFVWWTDKWIDRQFWWQRCDPCIKLTRTDWIVNRKVHVRNICFWVSSEDHLSPWPNMEDSKPISSNLLFNQVLKTPVSFFSASGIYLLLNFQSFNIWYLTQCTAAKLFNIKKIMTFPSRK